MHQYLTDLVASRQADNPRSWLVFGLMSAINGALLASLSFANTSNGANLPYPHWRLIVPVFALTLCIIWHAMQRRLVSWSRWDQNALAGKDKDKVVVSELLNLRKDAKHPGLSTKNCIWVIPFMFAAVWEVLACHEICRDGAQLSWPISIGVVGSALVCIVIGVQLCGNEYLARRKAKEEKEKARQTEAQEPEPKGEDQNGREPEHWLLYVVDLVPVLFGMVLIGFALDSFSATRTPATTRIGFAIVGSGAAVIIVVLVLGVPWCRKHIARREGE